MCRSNGYSQQLITPVRDNSSSLALRCVRLFSYHFPVVMDPYGPPFKRTRYDMYGRSINGSNYGSLLDSNYFSPPLDSRFRPTDSFASERDLLAAGLGAKAQACMKFFSTSGCPYGEGCHYTHNVPGGVTALGLTQGSSFGNSVSGMNKSASGFPLEHESLIAGGVKVRMCKNYDTPEGCRFGEKCHFAHGEKELRKANGPAHDNFISPFGGPVDSRFGGLKGYREPTPPGLGAAAFFGASSTAKISIDASLAGAVIGKGGVNAKTISRITGAKLSIREHPTDSNLRNIEMEGSFDQIKQASAMVRELLMHQDVPPAKPAKAATTLGPHNYKTKLCENFPKGTCTFGDRCHFAHGSSELAA